MKFFWLIFAGFTGGILGGMGMGGGTLLIPILTMLLGVEQKMAQAINLVAFVPMAVCALARHAKSGLIDKKRLGYIIIPAVISIIPSVFLALSTESDKLRVYYGIFLIVLGVISLGQFVIKTYVNMRMDKFFRVLVQKTT